MAQIVLMGVLMAGAVVVTYSAWKLMKRRARRRRHEAYWRTAPPRLHQEVLPPSDPRADD